MDPINMIEKKAYQFQLKDLAGNVYSLKDLKGWIVVIYFWSAECDWCARVDDELKPFLKRWKEQVKVLWIASNANESRNLIEKVANERSLTPVLFDEHQNTANLFGAETTPHFFIIDTEGNLAYQGAWDDISFRQRVATQKYVMQVIEALMQNLTPKVSQSTPYGCVLVRFSDAVGHST
jgi:peroxiredoxin